MIKAEYVIKAANLVWLIWDNTKKVPLLSIPLDDWRGIFVIALQKLFYCIVKAILLHCKSYAITW